MQAGKSHGAYQAMVFAALAVVGFTDHAQATTKTWIGGSNQWSTSTNWSPSRPTSAADMALLTQVGRIVTYDVANGPFDVGTVLIDSSLTVKQVASGTEMNAGTIFIGANGGGTYSLSNGSIAVANFITLGQNVGGSGTFMLSGIGSLSAGSENIGADGAGTFAQSGGQNSATNLNIAGLYTLSAGSLGAATISGAGTFSQSGGTATITGSSVNRIGTLSISGGTLDLANHDLIVSNTPSATTGGYIKTAYGNATWNGPGLTSHAAAIAASSGHPTALGYAMASGINIGTFDGQAVSGAQTLVKYTWSGDANLDGTVNLLDLNALATNFGLSSQQWYQGDFNYDGTVNINDFNALALNFGEVAPTPGPALGTLLPEPCTGIFVGMLAWSLNRPRRFARSSLHPIVR